MSSALGYLIFRGPSFVHAFQVSSRRGRVGYQNKWGWKLWLARLSPILALTPSLPSAAFISLHATLHNIYYITTQTQHQHLPFSCSFASITLASHRQQLLCTYHHQSTYIAHLAIIVTPHSNSRELSAIERRESQSATSPRTLESTIASQIPAIILHEQKSIATSYSATSYSSKHDYHTSSRRIFTTPLSTNTSPRRKV